VTEPGPFERLGAFIDTQAEQVLEQLQRAFQSGGTTPPQMTAEQARNIARALQQLAQCYADAQMPREAENARRDPEGWEARAASMEARPTP
jgi:hypothetical protein